MPNARGKNKAKHARRTHKVSKGIHGASKHPLTPVQRALLGKGAVQSFAPVKSKFSWSGTPHVVVPFNKAQADENAQQYPHLFEQERRGRRAA